MLKRFAASTAVLSSLLFSLGVVACTGQKTPNIKVQFINSSVGWIIGPRLLQTTDGGRTWSVIRSEGFGTFQAESIGYGHRSIQFIDSAKGVQLGGNLIAKTTDGGRTWGEQSSNSEAGWTRYPAAVAVLCFPGSWMGSWGICFPNRRWRTQLGFVIQNTYWRSSKTKRYGYRSNFRKLHACDLVF